MFFFRRSMPQPRFALGLLLGLVVAFMILLRERPILGLSGLGTVAIIAAGLVEANHSRIWEAYRQQYKKRSKRDQSVWTRPSEAYYRMNVIVLWPLVAILGVWCLWLAYTMG